MPKTFSREEQDKILQADVDSVLAYRRWIKYKTKNNFDFTRILGILAAGKGAENYLPYTIPKITKQISEIGVSGDIIIGLNNGFECETVINRFTLLPNVQVIHLYTAKKVTSTTPAKIFDNLNCEGEPYCLSNFNVKSTNHRIFVVHQKEGLYSAGKIRILGDIYGSLLFKSIDNGWIPPAVLLTFDAESEFLVNYNGVAPQPDSNGLRLIVKELQNHPEIDILGANNRYAIYQKATRDGIDVLLPDFNEELPPIQKFLNVVHGKYIGYNWKPGGGTIGKSDVIISLLVAIAEKYPGTRSEDVHLTLLAQKAGFLGDIFMSVIATNRVPSLSDMTTDDPPKLAWMEQVHRWSACIYALEMNYGKHNAKLISSANFAWNVLSDPIGFLKRFMQMEKVKLLTLIKKLEFLFTAFFAFIKISKKASKNPDILQDSEAKASW